MKIRKGVEVKIKGTDYSGVVEWVGVYDGVMRKVDIRVADIGDLTVPVELLELPLRDEPESGIVMTEGETYHFKTYKGWFQLIVGDGEVYSAAPPRTWTQLNECFGDATVFVPEEE